MNRAGTGPGTVIMDALKCRFCLEPHYPASGSFSILNLPFSIALKRVFSFEVKSEQHLPDYACKVCSSMVWKFYTYSVMVEDNQHKLQQECSSMNAVTPRNLAGGYRMNGHEHLAIKREPIELSNNPVPTCSNNAAIDQNSQHSIKAVPQDEASTPHEAVVSREVVSEVMAMPVSENAFAGDVNMEERDPIELSSVLVPTCASNGVADENAHHSIKPEPQEEAIMPDEVAGDGASEVISQPVSEDDDDGSIKLEEYVLQPYIEESDTSIVNKITQEHQAEVPVVNREVASVVENGVSANIEMEKQGVTTHDKESNTGIAEKVSQEHQAEDENSSTRNMMDYDNPADETTESDASSASKKNVLENGDSANIEMEKQGVTTHDKERNTGIAEKVTQELQAEDENSSTRNMMDYDNPADETTEPDASSTSSSHNNAHNQTQTEKDQLILCDKCESWFANLAQLRNHQRIHKTSECPICKRMIKGDFISQHLAAHEGAFHCDICDATFGCSSSLRIHKDLKHADDSQTDDEKFPCKLCEQTFQNKTQLSRHQRQHKMARCNICNEQIRSTLMQNHMSVHRGAYHCEVCKKPFSSRTNLMRHKRAKHTPKVLSEYIGRCDRCGLTFPNQTKLSAHIKGHQRKQCHICKKEFRPNKIKEHLASHDGAFRCGNCKKTFSTKYSLKKHNRVSTRCTAESSDSDSEYELSPESTDESV